MSDERGDRPTGWARRWAAAATPEQADRMLARTVTNVDGATYQTQIEIPDWPEPRGLCQVCGERPATEVVHGCPGGMTFECRRCILRAMVRGAREQAARLPDLERELAEEEAR